MESLLGRETIAGGAPFSTTRGLLESGGVDDAGELAGGVENGQRLQPR
jgi:hypothetical protein